MRSQETDDVSFEELVTQGPDIPSFEPFVKVPPLVLDVTIPVRYSLDPTPDSDDKVGLRITGNKQNLVGFFNPIPSCLKFESENPYLCIIYKRHLKSERPDDSVFEIAESYYREKSKVEILV